MDSNIYRGFFKETVWAQILLVLLLAVFLSFFRWSYRPDDFATQARVVFNAPGQTRIFEGGVIEDMTVLDALNAASAAGNLRFEYNVSAKNEVAILNVNGLAETAERYFVIRLNDRPIETRLINQLPVKPGDIVTISTNE